MMTERITHPISTHYSRQIFSHFLPYIVAVVVLTLTFFLWKALSQQEDLHLSQLVTLETQYVNNTFKTQLNHRITALKHLTKHLNDKDFINFDASSEFQSVAFINKDFFTNTKNLSFDSINFLKNNQDLIKSYLNKELFWLSPVISNSYFLLITKVNNGYLIGQINKADLPILSLNTLQYAISVADKSGEIFNFGPKINLNQHFYTYNLNFYGSNWKFIIQPTAFLLNVFQTALPEIILFLGILLSLLLGLTTYLLQLSKKSASSYQLINQEIKKESAERKLAEESKKKLEKALQQGQKLQAIGTLAGGIAHDFNNILYAIRGYVEMAREDVEKETHLHKNLGKVLEATQRGQELIARILIFSRRQHHNLSPIYIKTTIEGVLDLLRPTIPASVNLQFEVICDDCLILGNQTQLHQVIVNLINNAVDAMDGEGTIKIKLEQVPTDDEILKQLSGSRVTNYCKVEIIDTGHGMDQSTIERIFEPFYTTKEVGKGTGLGLATAHSIIKEHQGEILVDSRLGHGTIFTILLPIYKQGENNGENSVSGR